MGNNVEERILDIRVRYDDAIRKIADYKTQLDVVRKVEQTLKEDLRAGRVSREQYNLKMTETKVASLEITESIRILNKEIQNNRKIEREQEGSLASLRAQLSNLTSAYDKLSEADRKTAKGMELQAKINEVTDQLNEAEQSTQRFYRNVGNYEAALLQATQANVPFISSIMQMQNEMGGVKGAFTAGRAAVATFGKQLLSLLANPIVAILAGIAVVVMAVSKAINSSEEASNRWAVITAPLSRLLNGLLNIVQVLAGGILSVVEVGAKMTNWLAGLAEKIPGVGKYIKEMNDANREAIALERERQAIEKQERSNMVQNAKDALAVSELRTKAKDKEKYTAQDRLSFVKEANRLEDEQAKRNVDIAERKLKALQIESSWAENNAETNRQLAELEAEVYNRKKECFDKTRELKEQENTLIAEQVTAEKAAADKQKQAAEKATAIRKKELDEVRKAEDELLKLVKDGKEKQSTEITRQYSRQIEDLRVRLKTETDLTKTAKEAINQQIVSLEKQKMQDLKKLSDEQLIKDIEARQKLLENLLGSVKTGTEQEFQLKMQQLVAQRDAELAQKELTEEMKLAIAAKYNKKFDELTDQHNNDVIKKQQDALRIRFETEIAQAYNNEQEVLRIKMEQKLAELNNIQQLEGESLEAFNLRKIEINNAYLDAKKAHADKEVEIEQAKYQVAADITNSLSALADAASEHSRELAMASKVLALAEIAINTGKAIAAGIAQSQSVPFPGNIAAIATTITTVLTNITSAINTVKSAKFAQGGSVSGPGSGTSDSIPAMLSNGESVMTAATTSMFSPLLSAFNQIGGGIPINVTASSNQALGEDMLAKAVAKGMMMAPPPVLSVEEFTSVANRVKYIENLGSL